jgi:hypothetical protein
LYLQAKNGSNYLFAMTLQIRIANRINALFASLRLYPRKLGYSRFACTTPA